DYAAAKSELQESRDRANHSDLRLEESFLSGSAPVTRHDWECADGCITTNWATYYTHKNVLLAETVGALRERGFGFVGKAIRVADSLETSLEQFLDDGRNRRSQARAWTKNSFSL